MNKRIDDVLKQILDRRKGERPPEDNREIFVIAGNYAQFRHWCYQNKSAPRERGGRAYYVDTVEKLYGLDGRRDNAPRIVYVGTYYKRDDWGRLLEIIQTRGFKGPYG